MKIIAYTLLFALMISCAGQKKKEDAGVNEGKETAQLETPAQDKMLLGLQERDALKQAPFNSWYDVNYSEYEPDPEMVEKLKPLADGLEVTVFMGTWCGDSKREVPAFFKLLDQLGVAEDKVTLITMNREKTTPENLEEGLDITNVPTLIFFKDGKELNRIVEYPIESLEEDMYAILSGQEYKHAYAW